MIVLEIPTAHQHQDAGVLIIESDHGALEIIRGDGHIGNGQLLRLAITGGVFIIGRMTVSGLVFRLIELTAQRLLRDLLQFRVDRGVNPVAFVHGAVPADRGDDLLPDVIHGVSLAPARFVCFR